MSQLASGVLGAFVATYTTFLPSFLFIFLGAPYIEKLRANVSLAGSLAAVTAAVVGVILNLALVFGLAVIAPDGTRLSINWFALVVSIAAFVALFKFKVDVLWVIVAGGFLGVMKLLLTPS
jgi:chromate transporter